MLSGLDHLVVVVPDLDDAVRSYRALGFTVVPGGRHAVATHNALIALEDGAYLELIAFYEPSPAHRWWMPLARGGGLVDFCAATDDLAGDATAFRRAGVAIDEPRSQSRRRPDGSEVRWVFSLPTGAQRGVVPFLIRDETPRAARVPRETSHGNGASGIGTLTVAVDDVAAARAWYAPVLGQPGQEVRREDLGGAGVAFRIGPHVVELVAPGGPAGPLREWLAARGPSPYAVTLRGRGGVHGPLDPTLTRGARLALA